MNLRFVLGCVMLGSVLTVCQGRLAAQAQPPAQPAGPESAQKAALMDLTGNWVSVVDQDWRFRMITPPKGDFAQVPLNAAGRKLMDQFDPAQYGGANYQTSGIIDCRAYGVGALMHMPTRLRISWESPDTLKIETDWGVQTRLIHFDSGHLYGDMEQALRRGEAGTSHGSTSMQGYSFAMWEQPFRFNAMSFQRGPQVGRGGGLGQERANIAMAGGDLAVVTVDVTPGWLRRNGVPYSSRTRVLEHYQTFQDPTGKQWFDVTTEVIDPDYLNTPFVTSADFLKEPDGAKWAPHACKQEEK